MPSGGAKKPLEYAVIFQGFFASSGGKKIVIKWNMFSFTGIPDTAKCFMLRFFVAVLFMLAVSAFAQEKPEGLQNQEVNDYFSERGKFADTLATLTGTAVNPLLISGVIGVYKYYTAPDEAKNLLPWYYKPWFWTICLVLVALAYIPSIPSDIFNLPPTASKFIELCNKKLGLLLTSPILFNICTTLAKQFSVAASSVFAVDRQYVYASILPWEWLSGLPQIFWFLTIIPVTFFVFFAMWLLNYVFDLLIFLCPFGWIDLLLKISRGMFFALLLVAAVYIPLLVYVLVIPVMIISVLLFGWSARRTITGFVSLRDFVFRRKEASAGEKAGLVFSDSNKG